MNNDDVIRKGDLVMVVKPTECCGYSKVIGMPFTVSMVEMATSRCSYCGHEKYNSVDAFYDARNGWVALTRLRKINPPETGEYTNVPVRKTEPKEVTA